MKAKGIITKPRPAHWFNFRDNKIKDEDNFITRRHKKFNQRIAVDRKTYFMIYNYQREKSKYNKFMHSAKCNAEANIGMPLSDIISYSGDNSDILEFAYYYNKMLPVSNGDCVINKICRLFEQEFDRNKNRLLAKKDFDYHTLMTDVKCDSRTKSRLRELYNIYKENVKITTNNYDINSTDKDDLANQIQFLKLMFRDQCNIICPNQEMQANALLEIIYGSSNSAKRFTWDMCGEQIINNLLKRHSYIISYPVRVCDDEEYDFTYRGEKYAMCKSIVEGGLI